ncbi:hypothetical protein [Kamptonema formosum]|uniref:hypothetical protein n=1 Tax=Kamptonema formosum TaxID=331992 RepID=UPI004048AA89
MVAKRELSEFMASPTPLHGLELIDCAKANAMQGIETAAQLCGYGEDIKAFERELQEAGDRIGVKINELSDLITAQQVVRQAGGIEIAPDTPADL